jgi:hypothetical protein
MKITVEDNTAVNCLSPVAIGFKAQVIDKEIAVDCPGKRE